MDTIKERIDEIKKRIREACINSGRDYDSVTLMAVSKTKTLSEAVEASECGAVLGENYVQEFKEKVDLRPDLPWHFIGHLQTNKVKYVVPRAFMIHSVDSLHLAEKINSESEKIGKITKCLLEINSGGEMSKFGLTIDETPYIIEEMKKFKNICLKGLMTIPPYRENGEENREIFKKMRETFEKIREKDRSFDTLSMGMSSDFTVAVEEGATLVRVGTAIFGERNYNK